MKKVTIPLIIFIFIFPVFAQAEEIPLTLQQAVSIALRDNRDVLLKAEDLKKAKLKIAEAESGLLPSLSLTGTWSDTRGYYAKDITQATTQATLKQYLYKGSKTINTIKQKQDSLEVFQALLDKAKLELVLNVEKAFYTLLLSEEYANLNSSIVKNIQQHLEAVQARYKTGEVPASDILQIQKSLSSAQDAWESSLIQVQSGMAALRNLLYLDESVIISLKGDFSYEPREAAYEEGFLLAMKNRPEIKQYEAQVQADKKAIEIAKADNRPSVYASWDYYSRSHSAVTATRGWNDYNVLGLTFSWPIFDGWATKAKVEQAIVDLKETQLSKEKTTRDIALELKNAYLDLKNALVEIKSVQAQVDLYADTLSTVQEKYKSGIASSLDLSDAILGHAVSLFNQKEAIYDYILAKAKFDKATGGL